MSYVFPIGTKNPNWKGGVTLKEHRCNKCNKPIGETSALYGSGLCHSCALYGKKHHRYIDGRSKKKYYCKDCGKEISRHSGFYGSGLCRSCSNKGKRSSKYKDGRYIKEYFCKDCGRQISYRSATQSQQLCRSCSKKGDRASSWKGGISRHPYFFDFNEELKELIRKRDNYKCVMCGTPQEECFKGLSIHHIDYNKENSDPKNLISLCEYCHGKTGFNRGYWKSFLLNKRYLGDGR